MAIQYSDLTYPKAMSYSDINDMGYFSGIRYYGANPNTIMWRFTTDIPFTADYNAQSSSDNFSDWMDMFTYKNGVKIQLRYKKWLEVTGMTTEVTHINLEIQVLRYSGTVMSYYSSTASAQRTVTNGVAYREPLKNFHFVPCGYVDYVNGTNVTQSGDPATGGIGLVYALWVEEHTPINMVAFNSINTNSNFTSCFGLIQHAGSYTDQAFRQFYENITNNGDGTDPFDIKEPDKPYDPSGPGGGDGPQYGPTESDPIDFPALPTGSVFVTGLVSAYNPESADLTGLANELWSNNFVNTIEKVLNDPFDGLIGLSMYPFDIPTNPATAIKIGNYTAQQTAKKVVTQYIKVTGGSLEVPLAWFNFLDFTQTKVSVFIPFVGIVSLNPDDVMGKTLTLEYNIDLLSGAGAAYLKCGISVLYTHPVNVGMQIPLTGGSKGQLYTGLINVGVSAMQGAIIGNAAGAVVGGVAGAITTAASKQSDVQRSGSIAANSGVLSEFTPYVIIHRPVQSLPASFKQLKGYTSNISATLSSLSGYTEVEYVHLNGITGATDTELEEIETLLKNGVII